MKILEIFIQDSSIYLRIKDSSTIVIYFNETLFKALKYYQQHRILLFLFIFERKTGVRMGGGLYPFTTMMSVINGDKIEKWLG